MVRVAAKPSRPALRSAKASGCPTAAVAFSATGNAPLQATSARTRRRRVCSAKALWHRKQTDARCAPLRRNRGSDAVGESALASRLGCLRRGTFHRGKVPKTRRGLWPPVPCGALRRASQEKAAPGPLRSTKPSRPILPPPSRLRAGQWNRMAVTATVVFSKAALTASKPGFDLAHGSFYVQILRS